MKIRVGPAETRLFDTHLISTISEPHRADIFQLHAFKFKRQAGEICFHGQSFWARTEARNVKMAVHQTVAIQPGKVQGRDDERIEINSFRREFRIDCIIAPEPNVHLACKPPGRHRRINRCTQVAPIRIDFPVKASHHVIAEFQVHQSQRCVQFGGA